MGRYMYYREAERYRNSKFYKMWRIYRISRVTAKKQYMTAAARWSDNKGKALMLTRKAAVAGLAELKKGMV